MAETLMITPRGDRSVKRPHTSASSPLRAWSAADQMALDHLGTGELGRVLIVNDEFGALTVGLADTDPVVWTDSALSRAAIVANIVGNGLDAQTADRVVCGDMHPLGNFDTVIVRIPKTVALLEHQLRVIRDVTSASTVVLGAAMARHIHRSTLEAFERVVGPTTTSRAERKARLIFAERASELGDIAVAAVGDFVTDRGIHVAQLPGTFSADHIDVGSALLLDVLQQEPTPPSGAVVADLGCGNGVLGATMAKDWTDANFVLVDVSDLAIAAAKKTWQRNDLGDRARFVASDGFEGMPADSCDVVVTNPPFHQGHALDPDMTDRLLADVARVLKRSGVAYVVAQRHLNLHTRMKRWFDSVEVRSGHPTHIVLAARFL